jgi:hypothetical protein
LNQPNVTQAALQPIIASRSIQLYIDMPGYAAKPSCSVRLIFIYWCGGSAHFYWFGVVRHWGGYVKITCGAALGRQVKINPSVLIFKFRFFILYSSPIDACTTSLSTPQTLIVTINCHEELNRFVIAR